MPTIDKFEWQPDPVAQRLGRRGGSAKRRSKKQMIRDLGIHYFFPFYEASSSKALKERRH